MINKCNGCGAIFQTENKEKEGYVEDLNSKLCERCFRIRNYNEYQTIVKDNNDFINILKKINETNSLVVLVVDVLNINKDVKKIADYLSNDILLVYTKMDLMPSSIHDEKILSYDIGFKPIDKIVVSANKNYNLDEFYEMIYSYKKDKDVYFVGYSNVGKSTLINKIIYNYSDIDYSITTSNLPSTTIDLIDIKLNDELTIMDTPGVLETGNIINMIDGKTLKNIEPKRRIKPLTYQIKGKQYINIHDLVYLEFEDDNDITIYASNSLEIERVFKPISNEFETREVEVDYNSDLVILGLGFIKVKNKCKIKINTFDELEIFNRSNLI